MALIAVGVNHEHATLDFLERATVPEHEWGKVLRTLVSHRNIHEAVFLSTCLRTEVIADIDFFHGAIEDVTMTLAEATGIDVGEFHDRLSVHFDRGVVTHLMRVAAGLQSIVPGEFEILGQLRRALELAEEEHTTGQELRELFHRAIATGRRVRTDTAIARGTTSFAFAAVSMALDELGPAIRDTDVVVVGAGQLATGVVKSLLDAVTGPSRVTVVNRTYERAEALVESLADPRVVARDYGSLVELVAASRLTIVAAEAPSPLLTHDDLAVANGPLLVIDLGIPRAVEADVADLTAVRRLDIGELQARIERVIDERRDAVEHARRLVDADVEKFLADRRARGAAGIVRDLRTHFDEVVAAELERRAPELATFDADELELVRSVVRSVVAKLAHRPTIALKETAGTDQGVRLADATRSLFDL